MPKPNPKPLPAPSVDMVEVDAIVADDRWQVRRGLDAATVGKYAAAMEAGAEFPPVLLSGLNGALVLVSGFHRYHAAKSAGRTALLAEVHPMRPERLLWRAAAENLTHGLPMKAKDHRGAFRAYVKSGMHRLPNGKVKASRTIATELNNIRSHATVLKWMESDFPSVYALMAGGTDEPTDAGGLQEQPPLTEEQALLQSALDALGQLKAAAPGIKSASARGELIEPLKAVLGLLDEKTAEKPDF
jgi:uncharacterized ParB-like nuclease family protein